MKKRKIVLILILVCLYIIFYATSIRSQQETIVIENINGDLFAKLSNEHEESLVCSCSIGSISYETFVSMNIQFHEICSSYFISSEWIESLYLPTASRQGVGAFQTTASLQVNVKLT